LYLAPLIHKTINLSSIHKTNQLKSVSPIEVLAYFDIFNHPLTKVEIKNLTNKDCDRLIKANVLHEFKGYYSLNKNVKELVVERLKKEKEAEKYIRKLPFFVSLISYFPFVRGIAISGSLSKGVMYSDGDIDYFIVTAANRLWICRSFLVLFKKVFLLNSKKYFCVNYFVDENNLEIPDRNMFTAVEISYLIPVYNNQVMNQLLQKNSWTKDYFSDFQHPFTFPLKTNSRKRKNGLEIIIHDSIANKLDLWLMKKTFKRWSNKFKNFNADKFELTMRTNRGVSKHHPQDFQNKVLKELEDKMLTLKKQL